MAQTKIEWADETINFVTGCRHKCSYCYARRLANRFAHVRGTVYNRLSTVGEDPFSPAFHRDVYDRAIDYLSRARKTRRVFLNSMGDICCDGLYLCTKDIIDRESAFSGPSKTVIDTMLVQENIVLFAKRCPKHIYLILTKHPSALQTNSWPDNVYIGTSFDAINERIAHSRLLSLMRVKARIRWVSIEPFLNSFFSESILTEARSPDGKPLLNWVVIGGLSNGRVTAECIDAAKRVALYATSHGIKCFVKDNMRRLDPTYRWPTELV